MPVLSSAPSISPQDAVANLLLDCRFIGRSDTEITMQLPINRTPLGIVLEANRLSFEMHRKPLVAESQLDLWRSDPNFTTPIKQSTRIYLQTNLESVSKCDKITEIELLTIAQMLYKLDHGKDILQGNMIKLQDFALVNCSNGLHAIPVNEIESCALKYNQIRSAIETGPW